MAIQMSIKNTVIAIFDPCSSIVKSVFDCNLSGVIIAEVKLTLNDASTGAPFMGKSSLEGLQNLMISFPYMYYCCLCASLIISPY